MSDSDILIRTKGLIDNMSTLAEAAAACRDEADHIEALAEAGATIGDNQGDDGYIFVYPDTPEQHKRFHELYFEAPSLRLLKVRELQAKKGTSPGPESGKYDMILRAKWLVASCDSLTDIANNIRGFADYLDKLSEAGLELSGPYGGDYIYLYTDDQSIAKQFDMNNLL